MQTTCPHCKTVFMLTEAQLAMAEGEVRCGMCHEIFNALQDISQYTPNEKQVDIFDEEIFQEEEEPRPLIPDAYRHATEHAYSSWSTLGWTLAILLLCASLVVEYAWFNRNQLAQNAQLRPWLTRACELARCKLPALREPDKIELLSRNVYTHPNVKNALMITVTMNNTADYALAYPDIQVDFSNIRGGIVAARRFHPREYLHTDAHNIDEMNANTTVSFSLEVMERALPD